jgi:hypothetical protein
VKRPFFGSHCQFVYFACFAVSIADFRFINVTLAAGWFSAVHVTIALSGLTALGAEVVWTRLLSLMLGATVYTFSIILAVFLIGLGLAASVPWRPARRRDRD